MPRRELRPAFDPQGRAPRRGSAGEDTRQQLAGPVPLSDIRLILIDGLPGVGKTSIARELARAVGGVHLRIDSIEQALRNCGLAVAGEGYAVGYAVAEDNLRLGRLVVADCVNPWPQTRDAWRAVATRAQVGSLDVEVICSDSVEHRRLVESRAADIPGHQVPTWQDVLERDYYPWDDQPRLTIDTAVTSVADAVNLICQTAVLATPDGHDRKR